jgi:hypothetical protein
VKNNLIIITIVTAVVAGAGGFFGGMKYQQNQRVTFNRQGFTGQPGQNGARNLGQARNGFRPVNGEIMANDNNSITVKASDGGSKIVIISEKTMINKAETASIADLKTGDKVAVFGTDNSDGSMTAQNIQLNPMMRPNPTP